MKRLILIQWLAFSVVVLWPLSAVLAINVNEGQWQITIEAEMPGMPMKMPPMTLNQCITKDQLVPVDPQQQSNCRMDQHSVQGNTVTWTMTCRQAEGTVTSKGKITYAGDTFSGETKTSIPSQGMEMVSHMKGSRMGPCK